LYTPIAAVKSANGNVDRVLAWYYRRGVKMERNGGVTIDEYVGVRWNSIHSEIAWLDSGRVSRSA
jgi:hypothetical protein